MIFESLRLRSAVRTSQTPLLGSAPLRLVLTLACVILVVVLALLLGLDPAQVYAQSIGSQNGIVGQGGIGGSGCTTSGSAMLKGNGAGGCANASAGTDFAPATSGFSILKGNGSGSFANAVSGTDYAPATSGASILKGNAAGAFANAVSGTDFAPATSGTAILKGNGAGAFANAVSGTDYAPATLGSSLLFGNGTGGFSNVTIGANLTFSAGTLSASGGATPFLNASATEVYGQFL